MRYTLTFSHLQDGKREPYTVDGTAVTLTVEADSKTAAIQHQETADFCRELGLSVRKVEP